MVINNQRVYYNPQTKLVDIGIKKGDVCIALKRPSHKTDKERKIYSDNVDKRRELCLKGMYFEMEKDKHMELNSLMEDNEEYQSLLIELTQ